MEKIIYSKHSNERQRRYRIRTDIYQDSSGNRRVVKSAVTKESKPHIAHTHSTCKKLEELFAGSILEPNRGMLAEDSLNLEYIVGPTLEEVLGELLEQGRTQEFLQLVGQYVAEIRKAATDDFEPGEQYFEMFGEAADADLQGKSMPVTDLDLIFPNIIVSDKTWVILDYEWTFDIPIPVEFVLYRAASYFMVNNKYGLLWDQGINLYEHMGVLEEKVARYQEMEEHFQQYVLGAYKPIRFLYEEQGQQAYFARIMAAECQEQRNRRKLEIFQDYGKGFEKTDDIMDPNLDEAGRIVLECDVEDGIRVVRLDPAQQRCIVEIHEMKGVTDTGEEYPLHVVSNGNFVSESCICFDDADPQMWMNALPGNLRKVHMSLKVSYMEADVARILAEQTRILTDIMQSRSWRMTECLRDMGRSMRKTGICRWGWNILKSLKRGDVRAVWQRMKSTVTGKIFRYSRIPHLENRVVTVPLLDNEEKILDIAQCSSLNKTVAVHLHLYYGDLFGEMLAYLNHIPYQFDLYISCQPTASVTQIARKAGHLRGVNRVVVEACQNRGRDIAPLYAIFGDRIRQYDYFLHIHTKKSLYTGTERREWRQFNMGSLLGREDNIRRIFEIFESDRNVGLVFPERHSDMPMSGFAWLKNAGLGRKLAQKMNVAFQDGLFNYPAGSFFWAKTDALKRIFDLNLTVEDFPEEQGQNDGTLAHALERILPFCVQAEKQQIAIIDVEDGVVRYGKSLKPFREYFGFHLDHVKNYISGFDVISFDIFDTLITRRVYEPDDVFALMERKIKKQYDIQIDYLRCRKEAERRAWERKQAFTSIYDIYEEMPAVAHVPAAMAERWRELEIETELDVCIPRRDVISMMNDFIEMGKTVNLVSDMYLTSDIITRILDKCGCRKPCSIWVSCEKGKRKDSDTLWDDYFAQFGTKNTVHLGDNLCSDYQLVDDRGKAAFALLSPGCLFQLTKHYEKYRKYMDGSLEYSLILGMLVNERMFNSPFALGAGQGTLRFGQYDDIGFCAFGPLFTGFMQWLDGAVGKHRQLWFLAREGYLLQKMYDAYREGQKDDTLTEEYFLASRRAVTVAGIRNIEDLREVLSREYHGMLKNYLCARLGLQLYDDMENMEISIPEELDTVMVMLEPHYHEILEKCGKERRDYLAYVQKVRDRHPGKEPVVVDVGYSGTIQYYLAKLMGKKISGYYLCTMHTKPDKTECQCNALYPIDSDEELLASKINKNQLFLEAILKAPYGQLCYMAKSGAELTPVFKEDSHVSREVVSMQEGALRFISRYVAILNQTESPGAINKEFTEEIMDDLLTGNVLTSQQLRQFSVQDDYCSNGWLVYDEESHSWGVGKAGQ